MVYRVQIKQQKAIDFFSCLRPVEILYDRGYRVGDIIEFEIRGHGGIYEREISYISNSHGLKEGYIYVNFKIRLEEFDNYIEKINKQNNQT